MDRLAIVAQAEGSEVHYPPKYFHCGDFVEEMYLKQLVSEHQVEYVVRGRLIRSWEPINKHAPNNHWLDCAVMSWAVVDPWFNNLSDGQWEERLRAWHEEHIDIENDEPEPDAKEPPPDLMTVASPQVMAPAPEGPPPAPEKPDMSKNSREVNAPNPFDAQQAMQDHMRKLGEINKGAW